MNKNELILLKQTEIAINKYYKEYIKFMNISFNMPVFQIKFRKASGDSFANMKENNGKYILAVDPLICKTPFAKPTLYHEFTHIFDHIIMNQLDIHQSYIYHVYTEYHASQIEMMVRLNAITPYGTIDDNINHKSICEELLNEKSDFTKQVYLLDLSITKNFSKAVDLFCYYIGKVNTFLYYFNEYKDVLLDLSNYKNIFGEEIVSIQKALFQSDTINITVEDIINIADQHLKLVRKYKPQ